MIDYRNSVYTYGSYYTWAAAIADTSYYESGNHNTTSICPTGWHIPTGNTNGEYNTLNTEQNSGATNTSAGLRAYPANFIYSGSFEDSSVSTLGTYGLYWSSTVVSGNNNRYLSVINSSVQPGTTNRSNKYKGLSIRCLNGS